MASDEELWDDRTFFFRICGKLQRRTLFVVKL